MARINRCVPESHCGTDFVFDDKYPRHLHQNEAADNVFQIQYVCGTYVVPDVSDEEPYYNVDAGDPQCKDVGDDCRTSEELPGVCVLR